MPDKDLTAFIEEVTGERHLRVEDDLGDGFVVLRVSEAERRQARHDVRCSEDIVIEMLRNARDAHARSIFLAVSREGDERRITMIDDGDGIPEHMHRRIFDARVTSKLDSAHIDAWGVHGRGMALYAVRMNAKEAYVAASKPSGGTSIVVRTDTSELPEKSDQSSMPQFIVSDTGTVVVRGARNINRTVAEFAYVDRNDCTVYLGSPVEVAATLWEYGMLLLPQSTRIFCDDIADIDVTKRLALASSDDHFCEIAHSIGLELSQRSARRIMDGEIPALLPVSDTIELVSSQNAKKPSSPSRLRKSTLKDSRGLKLAQSDIDELSSQVKHAFRAIAEAYYLEEDVEVGISVRKDRINISIPVEKMQ